MRSRVLRIAAFVVLLSACGRHEPDSPASKTAEPAAAAALADKALPDGGQDRFPSGSSAAPVLLCLGDSLTAGYGVDRDQAWPALVQKKLSAAGQSIEVRNAGVSGSTTKGVVENLDWHLESRVAVVLLGIGANDGLRGLKLAESRKNLETIILRAQEKSVRVALLGMKIPPNYGKEYFEEFEGMYPALAQKHGLPLLPFLLEGVGGRPEMNIEDGIHPNPKGHQVIAERVYSFLIKEGLVP